MTEFRRHEKAKAEAKSRAAATGEPWCVCVLDGKFFARPKRKALAMLQSSRPAMIRDTFEPGGAP